jgi:hypothetical protein
MSEVALYESKNGKSLLEQYPDLYEVPQLKKLTKTELSLTWFYGNPTSPFVEAELGHLEKVEETFKAVYKTNKPEIEENYLKWIEKDFPQHIKDAIEAWSKMRPDFRKRSKDMIEHMIINLEKMVKTTENDFKKFDNEGNEIKGVDWSARNQYANFCRTSSEIIPTLIKQLEQGFGVTEKERKPGEKAIDKYHKIKD